MKPSLWVKKYKIKNEAGMPIEFRDHNFMRDIYDDMSPFLAVLKAPQIGATVMMIIKTMWAAVKMKWDVIYTLPTQSDVQDMAGGKINRLIAQNPEPLGRWVKDHDTVEQKSVGENIIYYRGTFTTKAAMMHSSDLNVHDEVDASNPEVITQYETRLQAKADGKRWYFSHPFLAGKGIDVHWMDSDKKEWFITCTGCGLEHFMSFEDDRSEKEGNVSSVNMQKECYQCKGCLKGLTADEIRRGVWKPTDGICRYSQLTGKALFPDGQKYTLLGKEIKEFSGYHISQMMCPWISARKIINDYRKKDRQYFYNYVLGLPYLNPDDQVSEETINQNLVDDINSQGERVIIGVDTGLPIHYTLCNREGFFFYGKCKNISEAPEGYDPYDELEMLLLRFPNSVMVSDQGGDLIGIRKLQKKYPGRVFLCYYRRDRKTKDIITWGIGKQFGTVVVDRNRAIEMLVEELKDKRINFNGSKEAWAEYVKHWLNIYRFKESKGTDPDAPSYDWDWVWKRKGADHYVHASLYARVGMDKFGREKGGFIDEEGPLFFRRGADGGTTFNDLKRIIPQGDNFV